MSEPGFGGFATENTAPEVTAPPEQSPKEASFRLKDFKGLIHNHSFEASPCAEDSLVRVKQAAGRAGLEYIAMSEHPDFPGVGSWPEKTRQEFAQIDRLNQKPGPRMFKGVEVTILEDGSVGIPEDILDASDNVVASVHYHFTHTDRKPTAEETTGMYCSALEKYPQISAIGHPLRGLPREEWEKIDWERICALAKERNVAIELDINEKQTEDLPENFYRAIDKHQNLVEISPDFHSVRRYFSRKAGPEGEDQSGEEDDNATLANYIRLKHKSAVATFNEDETFAKPDKVEEWQSNQVIAQEIADTGKVDQIYDVMLASEPDYVEVKNTEGQLEQRKIDRKPIPTSNLMGIVRKIHALQQKRSFLDPSKPLFDPARIVNLWNADQFANWAHERKVKK